MHEARAAAEDMMDAAIAACDVEAQQLQRSIMLQAEKWEWAVNVQQHSNAELKRKEHECQQLRQDLVTANRRHERQMELMARDRRSLSDLLKEINKHMEPIPRFRPLLKRLGVSEKIAAVERQSTKPSNGMRVGTAQAGLSAGQGSAPRSSVYDGGAPPTPSPAVSKTKVEPESHDSMKGAVPVRRTAWMQGEYRLSPAALPRPGKQPQQQNDALGQEDGPETALDNEPPHRLLEEWGFTPIRKQPHPGPISAGRGSQSGTGERDHGVQTPCKTEQDEHVGSPPFLHSLSLSEYDDKLLQLDQAVAAHRKELQEAHAHVERVNKQLDEEKQAFDRLVEAYEEIRVDNGKLVAQISKLQREQRVTVGQSPPVARSAKQAATSWSEARAGAKESKEMPAFVLRKIFAALADKRRSMLFSMLSDQEQRSLLAGKDKYLSPNAKVIKRRKNDMICKQGDVACSVLLVISGSQSALTPSSPRPRLLQPLRYCIICLGECAAIELD